MSPVLSEKKEFEHLDLLRADSILWDHIEPEGVSVKPSEVKTVLVTGSSGCLGPYVIRDLSQRSQITKIYCLIRPNKKMKPLERLFSRFKELEIFDEIDTTKVYAITGDVAESGLGLEEDTYDELANSVDAVVHLAVYANHLAQYSVSLSNPVSLRSVNVIGTQRVLEFAASIKTKVVYHASTFFAIGTNKMMSEKQDLLESWPADDEFEELPNFGYGQSKFVADRLIEQAIERGIPCKSFRFAKIGGDSKDGRQHVKTNHFFIKFLYYMKAETMPDLQVPLQIMAVDTCAKVTLDVFFIDEAPNTIYNVYNPHRHSETDIAELAKEFGFNVKKVKYDDFVEKLLADGRKGMLYHWTPFYTSEFSLFRIFAGLDGNIPLQDVWQKDPYFFHGGKIQKYIPRLPEIVEPGIDLLRKEINYAIQKYDIFKN